MPASPRPPGPRDLRGLRASDADRDRVVVLLSAALADGRLTPEEHAGRVEAALSARTLGNLAVLTTDLAAPAAQPIRLDGGRAVTGLFSRETRDGRWVVPPAMAVNAVCGEATVDFREALLAERHVVLYASALFGTVRLIVPDGVDVTMDGTFLLGRRSALPGRAALAATEAAPDAPERPLIEVRAFALLGEVVVKTPPRPRRWLPGFRRRAVQS